jgi:hypothetical protein
MKKFNAPRMRPTGNNGKALPQHQAVVHVYSGIQQLVGDNHKMHELGLVLVTISVKTLHVW